MAGCLLPYQRNRFAVALFEVILVFTGVKLWNDWSTIEVRIEAE